MSTMLKDINGQTSSMRVMCFCSLIVSTIFGYITLTTPTTDGVALTVAFLVGAFAPKAVQKFAEEKTPISSR